MSRRQRREVVDHTHRPGRIVWVLDWLYAGRWPQHARPTPALTHYQRAYDGLASCGAHEPRIPYVRDLSRVDCPACLDIHRKARQEATGRRVAHQEAAQRGYRLRQQVNAERRDVRRPKKARGRPFTPGECFQLGGPCLPWVRGETYRNTIELCEGKVLLTRGTLVEVLRCTRTEVQLAVRGRQPFWVQIAEVVAL